MLEEIRISGLGIIESSTLELGPGLTVVTGETGAGKTMIVTALGLLLGGRGDAGSVRKGKKAARVEGVIDARSLPSVIEATEEAGERSRRAASWWPAPSPPKAERGRTSGERPSRSRPSAR